MFPRRYFPARYFAPRYWPVGGDSVPTDIDLICHGGVLVLTEIHGQMFVDTTYDGRIMVGLESVQEHR